MSQSPSLEPAIDWLWRALVAPAPGVTDAATRRRMRVLAGVAFPLFAFAAIDVVSAPPAGRIAGLVVLGMVATAYAFARSTLTSAPAWILTAATVVIPYFGLVTPEPTTGPMSETAWSLLVPLVAGLALPARTALAVGAAHLVAVTAFTLLNPQIPTNGALHLSASVALVTMITVVAASVREGHEEALAASSEALRATARDLARAKALSENTVESMAEGLLLADGNRRIRLANPALCSALGYVESELLGQPLNFVLVEDDDDTALFEAPLKASRSELRAIEATFRTRTGDTIPMSCTVSTLQGRRDVDFGLVVLARDMRETLRVLEAAAEASAHRKKAAEIQRAHDRLLEAQGQLVQAGKLAALGELAGAVAHEVNNPLGAALLATDLAEEALAAAPADLELARRQLALIQDAIQRCQSVIDGLLDFSRQSSGDLEAVDLRDVVDSTLALISRKLMASGSSVQVELPEPLVVRGDRNQLGQVVLNLLMNASQAGASTIRISSAVTGREVRLAVRDDGSGMDPFVAQRIFEPFYTTKPRGQGTGLGLSISYGIAAEHRGWIDVQSEPDQGSTFTLVLPVEAMGPPT